MKSLDKITKLANKFVRKIALASTQSAQSGEIDTALKSAGVRPTAEDLSPLLDTAKVPEDMHLSIGINVDSGLNVKFVTNPRHVGLEALLNKTYSNRMAAALKSAGIGVTGVVYTGLATF